MIPKVDTFAKDISDEIKHKEASLADIATASNDIGNNETTPMENRSSRIFAIAIVFLVLGIMGLIGLIYYYFVSLTPSDGGTTTPVVQESPSKKASSLSSLSVTLNNNIGRNVESVVKSGNGYILTLSSYSPVFAYMTRNEGDYISELVDSLNGSPLDKQGKVKGVATTSASIPSDVTAKATSTTASSTKPTAATSTQLVATSSDIQVTESVWSDVTISNVNMRIYTQGDKSVAYAFISNEKLIIAKTKEDVLAIKSAILR